MKIFKFGQIIPLRDFTGKEVGIFKIPRNKGEFLWSYHINECVDCDYYLYSFIINNNIYSNLTVGVTKILIDDIKKLSFINIINLSYLQIEIKKLKNKFDRFNHRYINQDLFDQYILNIDPVLLDNKYFIKYAIYNYSELFFTVMSNNLKNNK
jgi:hypothetical protein